MYKALLCHLQASEAVAETTLKGTGTSLVSSYKNRSLPRGLAGKESEVRARLYIDQYTKCAHECEWHLRNKMAASAPRTVRSLLDESSSSSSSSQGLLTPARGYCMKVVASPGVEGRASAHVFLVCDGRACTLRL